MENKIQSVNQLIKHNLQRKLFRIICMWLHNIQIQLSPPWKIVSPEPQYNNINFNNIQLLVVTCPLDGMLDCK